MKKPYLLTAAALAGLCLPGPAAACGWDNETDHAEAKSLPCVFEILIGAYPQHTPEYYEARIAAADQALLWAPHSLEALDMKAVALIKLKRYEEARAALLLRAEADPDGYGTHANLGTLYTFTGELELALKHIDEAMDIEPEAHFGREKYHRMLVVYLQEVAADPARAKGKDFLGLELSREQRLKGSEAAFVKSGLEEDAFDALASMIAVYGADELPDLYFAFGNILALRGYPRLAYSAYQRAVELGHPRKAELKKWLKELRQVVCEDHFKGSCPSTSTSPLTRGAYVGIDEIYARERGKAKSLRLEYAGWEREQLKGGLPVWTDAGLAEIYKKQAKLRPRCKTPGLIREEKLLAPEEAPAKEAKP
jgi:tetratricopeptide (TPR) repeat protein